MRIEVSIPDRVYRVFLVTWCALVAGAALAYCTHAIKQSLPPSEPIVKQANGNIATELNALRRENSHLKGIIRTLDMDGTYAEDVKD